MLRAAFIVLLIALLPSYARAEAKIALLIGNEAYGSEIGRLANPHNDVALLEQALKGLGFEVAVARDTSLGALPRAVNACARRVQAAGPGAIGSLYYSGHGASDGSNNYLIPVDVKTTESGALWDESLRLTEITRKLKAEAGNARISWCSMPAATPSSSLNPAREQSCSPKVSFRLWRRTAC